MIGTLRGLLRQFLYVDQEPADDSRAVQLAMATLLTEVAAADLEIDAAERETIRRLVSDVCAIGDEEASQIAEQIEWQCDKVTSLYPFTRLLNEQCSMAERIEMVRMLWNVSLADGRIDAHEEHLVRKIADLLYVPHSQFVRTRLQQQALADK